MKDKKQTLFEIEKSWESEWVGMPEYDNKVISPAITVTFKFINKEDFDKFHTIIKKELYSGKKVFDGMQKKDTKSAWFPPLQKASGYFYE